MANRESPFPLQQNLKPLRPQPLRAWSGLLMAGVILYEPLREYGGLVLEHTEIAVAIGLGLLVLLLIGLDLFIRRIWFNHFGIGQARIWGGEASWYPFDELREVRGNVGPASGGKRRSRRGLRRLNLLFHSGSMRLWPSFYRQEDINELYALLRQRRQTMAESDQQAPKDKSLQPGFGLGKSKAPMPGENRQPNPAIHGRKGRGR